MNFEINTLKNDRICFKKIQTLRLPGRCFRLFCPVYAGLSRDSFAMTEQVRTISRARLVGRIGAVEADALADVLRWVRDWIA